MKLDYPLIIVIAGAFILGYCVASYKPKKEPTLDLTGAHMETHGWEKYPRTRLGTPGTLPPSSGTITKPEDMTLLYNVPIKGMYFNESTMKLMAVTIYGDYIEIDTKDIRLKKPK